MMNERIKERAKQAGWSDFEALDERNEKFAELIIRECMCLVLNGKHDEEKFDPTNEFHQGWNIALDDTVEGIKKHFGIEQ